MISICSTPRDSQVKEEDVGGAPPSLENLPGDFGEILLNRQKQAILTSVQTVIGFYFTCCQNKIFH